MNTIAVSEAFGSAPPRSAAVLCVKGENGRTDMMLTDWFTWLNIRRNPMISFSLHRDAAAGISLQEGDSFVLAFPPLNEAKRYSKTVSVKADEAEENEGRKPDTVPADGTPVRVPKGSEVLLVCTLAGAYNYPFKKVRIFNCNLEEARGGTGSTLD